MNFVESFEENNYCLMFESSWFLHEQKIMDLYLSPGYRLVRFPWNYCMMKCVMRSHLLLTCKWYDIYISNERPKKGIKENSLYTLSP